MNTFPMILAAADGFTWWGAFGLFRGVPHYFVMALVIPVVLGGLAFLVKRSVESSDPLIPKAPEQMGFGDWVREAFEGIVGYFMDLADSLMPHHHEGRGFLWLIVPLFLYIWVSNVFGLVPGFLPPTDSVNTNGAAALSVFILYHAAGIRSTGLAYAKHFWAPPGLAIYLAIPIGIVLGAIELFSHAFRPVTLSLRLYGNISGDHTVFASFLSLVPIGVPIVFLLFGLLVSTVQAFVFTLLTSVYIALATSHDH